MTSALTVAASLFIGLAVAVPASAQTAAKRKPGLWEVQSTQQGQATGPAAPPMPDMKDAMAKMSPQQREMVAKMMKDQGVATGAKPNSFRYCLSKELAERDFTPPADPDTDCTYKTRNTSATAAAFSFSCKRKDGSTAEGEGRAHDLTPDSYAMDLTMKLQHGGQPMTMQLSQQGRWLGSDCKGLKPLGG